MYYVIHWKIAKNALIFSNVTWETLFLDTPTHPLFNFFIEKSFSQSDIEYN